MTDYGSTPPSGAGDAELQDFLLVEKQKAQVNAQVSIYRPVRLIQLPLQIVFMH